MADDEKQLQLVTFQLGKESYGIEIMDVQEIVPVQEIRPMPNAPVYVEGILNLRGKIVPIINLHQRFQFERAKLNEEDKLLSGIIIVDIDGMQLGIMIDKVSRVMTIAGDTIQPPPQVISGIGAEYIEGVVNEGERYLIILDIRRLFDPRELRQLNRLSGR